MTTATRKPSKRYPGQSIPDAVRRAVCCRECGTPLLRTETGWVCRVGLDHTKLISDRLLLERIGLVLPGDATKPKWGTEDGLQVVIQTGRQRQLARMLRMLKRLSRKLEIPRPRGLP